MSINTKDSKTDGFVEDILSFDELQELEDLDELQTQRKTPNNQDEHSQQPNVENLEEGELSDCANENPSSNQPQYVDSDHSDEEIMKEIQAKVKLSKKRRRQNNFPFIAAPALISYNLTMPFGYPVPVQMWPHGFYPMPPKKNQKPVDLSLLDSDSDEFKEATTQKPSAVVQPNDPAEREEGSIDPSESSKKKKRHSTENNNTRKSEPDRDRRRERDNSSDTKKRHNERNRSKEREEKDRSDKHHKKEKQRHKEHRSRHK